MGKMKDKFIEQMNEQMSEQMIDADYQYQQYINQCIESVNKTGQVKYSDDDILMILHSVLGDANPANETIMNELNNLHNLRNGNIN